jgi:peptidoglycan/xylan/chitin deacetylase (PgdA/CDA1 family)
MPSFSLKHLGLSLAAAACVLSTPAYAAPAGIDSKAAVIFAYFAVGNDDNPAGSVTEEQFAAQIEELSGSAYNVMPLPDIIDAFAAGRALPDRTVAITFDGADKSVLTAALPLLEEKDLPFTVFIPADKIGTGGYLDWNDLRRLKRSALATFGIHPSGYSRLTGNTVEDIRRQINNSRSAIRKELDVDPAFLAYPYGEFDASYETIARNMGFKAAFGQQSGVAWAGDDRYALPRFTLTERYGDLDRFQMTANALPFPVKDVSPVDPYLKTLTPAIGFTVADDLAKSLKALSCFSSSDEKPKLEIMGSRVELRMQSPLSEDRPRINCTLPVATADGDTRWRWFGALYSVPQDLLEAQQLKNEKTSTEHASDVSDDISVE